VHSTGDFPWAEKIIFMPAISPPDHPVFYSSSRFTLNITRGPMAEMGFCPSGRLFEAAGCRVPVISDWWPGLEAFFEPGKEIIVARSSGEVMEALKMGEEQGRDSEAAYRRAMSEKRQRKSRRAD
jgi:spore maturation protein CgeB